MVISPWNPGKTKPDKPGLYHVSLNGHAYWSWWDGVVWRGLTDISLVRGKQPDEHSKPIHNQSYPWRGLIYAPEKPKFTSWKKTDKSKGRTRADSTSEGVSPPTPRPDDAEK
jgi:hypothetical protein